MLRRVWKLISMTFTIWGTANASRMAAALAYFAILSLAPCLMIAIAIAGYIFDDDSARKEIHQQVEDVTSSEIAETVDGLIDRASKPNQGIVAGTISICVLVFAASCVFTQLYDTFNDIWDISFEGIHGILFTLRKRLLGIAMVLIVGVLLIGALVLDSTMTYINKLVVDSPWGVLLSWIDNSLSYLLMPLVFSMMFWFFPATNVQWRDVWPAGILTACLVVSTRFLLGFYMEFSTTHEVYGVMGSVAVLLIWIYITGLVVFFGASFSHAWAETFGSRSKTVTPTENLKSKELANDTQAAPIPLALERRNTKTPERL